MSPSLVLLLLHFHRRRNLIDIPLDSNVNLLLSLVVSLCAFVLWFSSVKKRVKNSVHACVNTWFSSWGTSVFANVTFLLSSSPSRSKRSSSADPSYLALCCLVVWTIRIICFMIVHLVPEHDETSFDLLLFLRCLYLFLQSTNEYRIRTSHKSAPNLMCG